MNCQDLNIKKVMRQLDFILKYDIEYRLGRDDGNEEE
jgi:hypothetical protein